MTNEQSIRGFYLFSEMPTHDLIKDSFDYADRLNIGYYFLNSGGTKGEFSFVWKKDMSMSMTIHDDALNILADCSDLFTELKVFDKTKVLPADVLTILNKLGFKNFNKK